MNKPASGIGIATISNSGITLDVWYPSPSLAPLTKADQSEKIKSNLEALALPDPIRGVTRKIVEIEIDLNVPPKSTEDAYLRLHLLSHRLVAPHGLALDGIFPLLANVVWTSQGPCENNDFEMTRMRMLARGPVIVYGADKFPRMVDYVMPSGVRIADADRVRLGAHLASGTTVMHEGFINFNAGTLGTSMVEGRISAGVVVDDGSDIGGGASIMGTLSGGGKEVISIGKGCLLGANSGLGISLGDNCIIESGTYITAASKVLLPDGQIVKARELSGATGLLFRRNSLSGGLEVIPRTVTWGGLNSVLHAN